MSTFGIDWKRTARRDVERSDSTEEKDDENPPRRSYSLRALIPGPYVRYPKE